MDTYVITIARGFGSGGKFIGQNLATRLGIPCYEREILTMASQKSGINESIFTQTDEKLRGNWLVRELRNIPQDKAVTPQAKEFVSDNNLFAIQAELIKTLAKTQSCVIVGKCSDYVLRDFKNVFSIYVDAPRDACVDSIMDKMNVTEKEANKLISKTDKYRADYYKYYTSGRNWVNPTNYHMFLNSAKVGRENCVDILYNIVNMKYIIK